MNKPEQQDIRTEKSNFSALKLPTLTAVALGLIGTVHAAEQSTVPEKPESDPTPVVSTLSHEELQEQFHRFDFEFKPVVAEVDIDLQERAQANTTSETAGVAEEQERTPINEEEPAVKKIAEPEKEIASPLPAAAIPETVAAAAREPAMAPPRSEQLRDYGIALATIGLGVLSVAAAIRGVVKGSIEVSMWRKSINRFNRREFTDMVALNAYSLIPNGDEYILQADTKDRPLLAEFLGGNRGARNYFVKAAKACTYKQPLVPLEFPRDYEEHWISKGFLKAITAPIHYLSFKRLFRKLHSGPELTEERFAGLNRINKLLREAVSASYNNGGSGVLAKQFQKELPLKYYQKSLYVIPVCSVAPPGVKQSRALSVITIGEEDFERFGNPDEVAKIKPASELHKWHIRLLKNAYKEYQAYRNYKNREGKPQELFPKVRVFIAYYDQEKEATEEKVA